MSNLASTGQCDPKSLPPIDSRIGGLQFKEGTSCTNSVVTSSSTLVRQSFTDSHFLDGEQKNGRLRATSKRFFCFVLTSL